MQRRAPFGFVQNRGVGTAGIRVGAVREAVGPRRTDDPAEIRDPAFGPEANHKVPAGVLQPAQGSAACGDHRTVGTMGDAEVGAWQRVLRITGLLALTSVAQEIRHVFLPRCRDAALV